MGAKKKKGSKRLSASDFDKEDALLTQILTESSRKNKASGSQASLPSSSQADPLDKEGTTEQDRSKELPTVPLVEEGSPKPKEEETETEIPSQSKPEGKSGDGKCQHVKNAIKLPKVRSKIQHQKNWNHCHGCINAEIKAKKLQQRSEQSMAGLSLADTGSSLELPSDSLWMCLSCCEINCGRMVNKHALTHHEDMKGNHPLSINLGTMDCWCYSCDNQIVPSKSKNQVIQECQFILIIDFAAGSSLKTNENPLCCSIPAASVAISKKTKGSTDTTISSGSNAVVVTAKSKAKTKVSAPGLQNLGNTCFFNSVVQVLTETKSLKSILSGNESEALSFPNSPAAKTDAGLGPLTISLKEFLRTMWKQQGGTVSPRELFTQIGKKWKVFRGFRQQDSQELMRYLFDGVKQEELDMIKRQLSEEDNKGEKQHKDAEVNGHDSAADEVSNGDKDFEKKKPDKTVGATPKYVPFIDSCFSGKLVSVIVCDACKKCSYATEDFFDLSLPVRGPAQAGAAAGSSLKARLLAQSREAEIEPPSIIAESSQVEKDPIPDSEKPSDAHMRHVEKVLQTIGRSNSETLSIQRSLNQFTGVDCLDGDNKFACENCYKLVNASKEKVDDASSANCAGSDGTKEPTFKESDEGSDGTKEPTIRESDVGSDGTKEPTIKESDVGSDGTKDPTTKESDEGSDEHTSDKDSIETTKVNQPEDEDTKMDKREEKEEGEEERGEEEEGEKGEDEDGEVSEEEQTDRFGNVIPKVKAEPKGKDKTKTPAKEEEIKYIFRKAYKRYLISKLPPTLVLHLKRFEQSGRFGQTRKIEDRVEIPVELDMSPYFVPKSEIEDEDDDSDLASPKQHHQDDSVSKKYRLYGAVIHMGTLGSGHYTNYVLSSKAAAPEAPEAPSVAAATKADKKGKSRSGRSNLSVNGQELPDVPLTVLMGQQKEKANEENTDEKNDGTPVEDNKKDEKQEEEGATDTRQWISCSDTSVRLSSLEEVLSSRAYLLFYERC
ncbi:Ubiquitin carboxyl-terminal hydrolase 16 [Mortierella sp. AD094]|nr:Ubiquitin carboxyl-terminal hydrolase 16 [Mortierella sp. AD094]